MNNSVAVIGAGSWGTALAKLLGDKGIHVDLWGHTPNHIATLQKYKENKKYLPGAVLPDTVHPENNLEKAVDGKRCVVMVVPSHGYREVFTGIAPVLADGALVVSAVKGIENETLQTMTQVMQDTLLQQNSSQTIHLGVLSGPSFAAEVAVEQPTAVTVAFPEKEPCFQDGNHDKVYYGSDQDIGQ